MLLEMTLNTMLLHLHFDVYLRKAISLCLTYLITIVILYIIMKYLSVPCKYQEIH